MSTVPYVVRKKAVEFDEIVNRAHTIRDHTVSPGVETKGSYGQGYRKERGLTLIAERYRPQVRNMRKRLRG